MKEKLILIGSFVSTLVFLAGCASTSAEPKFYPEKVPCPGPAVEVRPLNGAPAVFFDGKPDA